MGRNQGDSLDRAFAIAVGMLDVVDCLQHNSKDWIMARPIVRSGTSSK